MPLRNRNLINGPAILFLTTSTYNRRPFPQYPFCLEIIEKVLFETCADKSISLFGYVLMPTHIHFIVGSKEGGRGIAQFIHSFKGRVRIRLIENGRLWQDRYDDLVIKTEKQFRIKLDYIHNNPVKNGLVGEPNNWTYSSYNAWRTHDKTHRILFDFEGFYS